MRVLAVFILISLLIPTPASEQDVSRLAAIDTLIKNGQYSDAEKAARRALAEASESDRGQTTGADSAEVAHVLNRLGEALIRQGKTDADTQSVIDRALDIEQRLEPGTRDLAAAMSNKAFLVESRGDFSSAREWYQRAFETMRGALGPDHPDTVMAEKDVGMAWNELGEYEKARTLVEEALAIRVKADPAHVDVAILRHNLGAIEWQMGDYAAARDAFTAAAEGLTRAFGPDHPHVASALEGLAVVETNLGAHADALTAYRRVLAIRRKVLSPAHPLVAQTYVNMGDVLMSLGDYRAALDALNRGLAIGEKALGRDHPQLLAALTNLAVVLDRLGDHAAARRTLRRGIAIREKANGADDADLIIPLTQLGNLLADDGRWQEARTVYQRARTLGARTRGADHPYVAAVEIDEGLRLAAHGDTAEAIPLITHAREARLKALGREHPDAAAALDAHARLAAFQRRTDDAIREALDAEQIARTHFQSVAAVLPESQALLFAEARARSQDLALFVALRQPRVDAHTVEQLWDAVIRSRALVLEEVSWRRRFLAAPDRGRRSALDAAANARARLAQLILRGPSSEHPTDYPRELTEAREENERAETRLASESAPYERDRSNREIGFEAVRRSLPAGAALVSFVRYETGIFTPSAHAHQYSYAAFVLPPGGARPVLMSLGNAAAIDALVEDWRRRIRAEAHAPPMGAARRETAYRDAAAALRRRIWDPLAQHVARASRVLIVPDSALHLLDFATLPTVTGGYLVEAGPTIHYATAERDLLPESAPAGAGLLAVGAPAYDAPPAAAPLARVNDRRARSECPLDDQARFAPLPESGREIETIARLWREADAGVQLLSGRTASESAVRRDAPGRRVIHLATHGFVMADGCAQSRGNSAARSSTARTLASNPLLGAGLALAGASRQPRDAAAAADDGILTAEEIGGLNLQGVEWAVVSACDSGTGGTRAGEGIFGLRRAFQMAGVHSVIVSLWPVEDLMARQWMERLYSARLTRHRSTDEAVAEADRMLLSERRRLHGSTHPVYWSGFVAAGDWR